MSLASLLLTGPAAHKSDKGHNAAVDNDLDALFRANPTPITVPSNPAPNSPAARGHKRKRQPDGAEQPAPAPAAPKRQKPRKQPVPQPQLESPSEDDDDDADEDDARLEDHYLTKHTGAAPQAPPSSESDDDAPPPEHESHSKTPRVRKKTKKDKYVPSGETPVQRDARTIFIGNVPLDVARSKSAQKELKRHILTRVPGARIESVRFRSVGFAAPTSALPSEEKAPSARKLRAAQWRDAPKPDDATAAAETPSDDPPAPAPQQRLTPAAKKRVAFIKREFHADVDTIHAYVVFAHTAPGTADTAVHPAEAARLAVAHCDGTLLRTHTLRVDRVGRTDTEAHAADPDADAGDPRATLFVGNLDFAAREEELRVWFEGVVSAERGPAGVEEGDEGRAWVKSVRIVRDRDTHLGKGFAYVRFVDRECADEILALEAAQLRFAKRALRVQRCKPPAALSTPATKSKPTESPNFTPHNPKAPPIPIPIPRGNPLLGEKLAGLPKDARKAAKKADAERVRRRLAKKRAGVGKEGREKVKVKVKERVRERKAKGSKGPGKAKVKAKERGVKK